MRCLEISHSIDTSVPMTNNDSELSPGLSNAAIAFPMKWSVELSKSLKMKSAFD